MDIITWLIVGLVAGLLASWAMHGSGFGIIGDIALGIVGSVLGSYAFHELHWKAPIDGLAGVILIAFLGAIAVLAALRLVKRTRAAR